MRSLGNIPSTVEMIKDLLAWRRRTFEGEIFVLVDPVSRDGDRPDVSIASECADFADYEILWNGRNPKSAGTLNRCVVWERRPRKPNPMNEVRPPCRRNPNT
jgi:hypothetical protein